MPVEILTRLNYYSFILYFDEKPKTESSFKISGRQTIFTRYIFGWIAKNRRQCFRFSKRVTILPQFCLPTFDGDVRSRYVHAPLVQMESRKQCNFLKQYGISVYFEEVFKKLNICFEDLVKLVCLPEILKEDSVFGFSLKYKIKL